MVLNTLKFQGIPPQMVPEIVRFFHSAQVCSTIFKSYATLVRVKDGLVKKSSRDIALDSHKEMDMTVAFAGITSLELNTQFWTFTLEVNVVQSLEIVEWELSEYGKSQGHEEWKSGVPPLKIGCTAEIIRQIHSLLEMYQKDEILR